MNTIAEAIENNDKVILYNTSRYPYDKTSHIEVKQNGRYIQITKTEDKSKRYELDLKNKTYYGYYKNTKGDENKRQIKSKTIEKWVKDAIIFTYDYRLAKLIICNICYNYRKSNFIRFIEELNNPTCNTVEQWLNIININEVDWILSNNPNTGRGFRKYKLKDIYVKVSDLNKDVLNYIKNKETLSIAQINDLEGESLDHILFTENMLKLIKEEEIFKPLNNTYDPYYRTRNILRLIWKYNLNIDRFIEYVKYLTEYEYTDILWLSYNYEDYLDAEYILRGEKLSKMTKYPKNLVQAHHNRTSIRKIIEEEKLKLKLEKAKELEKQLYAAHKNLEYKGSKYSIVVPNNSNDVIQEGNDLNHCVGSYIGKISRGETFIVFMRKTEDINTSFITVEIKNGVITTALGQQNRTISAEERKFLHRYANAKGIKLKKT